MMTILRVRIIGECLLQVRDRCIAPDAPQLFALLLYLCRADGRAVPKAELLDLLFLTVGNEGRATHSLRQLSYRLRRMGAPIETQGDRLCISPSVVEDSLDDFAALTRHERLYVPASRLSCLPSYEGSITPQLADWVETIRSQATARVRGIVRDDFRTHRRECEWESVVTSGKALRALDAASEEVVSGVAEALLMLGRKYDALDEIDAFLNECAPASSPALQHLRGRVASSQERSRATEGAFQGRHDSMRALARQWTAALANRSQVATVVGPPGIGKSRLAREFSAYVALRKGQCLTYRCESSDHARPHSLFKHLLPHLRALRGSLGASPDLQHHLDRLSSNSVVPTLMEPASLEATRGELHLALTDLIEAVAGETPLLLAVDDAHLLDSASSAVLDALCKENHDLALMILCSYRSTDGLNSSRAGQHVTIHRLAPLDEADSLAVLRHLLPERSTETEFLSSCARRASGNPYFLHAVAHSAADGDVTSTIPFDIRTFAAATYYSLPNGARTLFESCLLLGRFASLRRVRAIADMDGPPLLVALRSLEDGGLLCFADGEIRCAHALLEEACRALIPSAVAAALHERIAQCLEQECISQGHLTPLAWSAAESWIAAGDVQSASRLLYHCAGQAAALGEPLVAANSLKHLPQSKLDPQARVAILGTIVEYEEAAAERERVCSSLRALRQEIVDLPGTPEAVQEVEFRIIEADLGLGTDPRDAIAPLSAVLVDPNAPAALRNRAGIRLLIAADMNLDTTLAEFTLHHLQHVWTAIDATEPLRVRAELIYETVFGDQRRAFSLALELLASQEAPALTQAAVSARRNAAFALSRLGLRTKALPVLLADYQFMSSHHVASEAAYSALLLADNSLCESDVAGAATWLRKVSPLIEATPKFHLVQAGYHSACASVALLEGRLSDAERLIDDRCRECFMPGLRYRAVDLALRLKVRVAGGRSTATDPDLRELKSLYDLGGRLGGQDSIVEALWLANRESGSELLAGYLLTRRRELSPPEPSLRMTTQQDGFWSRYRAAISPNA